MKKILSLLALLASLHATAQAADTTYKGKLQAGPMTLTMQLHVDADARAVTMDVIEQSAEGIPMTVNVLTADSINVSLPSLALSYAGRFAGDQIEGTFRQGAFTTALQLAKGTTTFARPQEPTPPYPYATEEVSFSNEAAKATLAGTLTLPVGYRQGQRVPVVLMVTGSGAQNRDEEVFHHRPFLVIADYLARHGIASLRYDDRGVAPSTGDARNATTRDLADDAAAGIAYLRSLDRFSKVGLLGHSEGGAIGFMLGAERQIDFLVSLSGPAGRIDTMMVLQINRLARLHGAPQDVIHTAEQARHMLLAQSPEAWMRYFVDMDLTPYVRQTTCPVLALGGDKDPNVPTDYNVPVLEANLPHHAHSKVKTYPGLSHLLQPNPTGDPLKTATISETIAPEVLTDIAEWIKGL